MSCDGMVTRGEFHSFRAGGPGLPPTSSMGEMQPLASQRIHRAEGSIVAPQITPQVMSSTTPTGMSMRSGSPSPPTSLAMSQPVQVASIRQPRVVSFDNMAMTSSVNPQSDLPMVPATVLEPRRLASQEKVTSSNVQELKQQTEADFDVYIRSMQETHTLQIRMLEELIEQKVNRAMEAVTMVSNQNEERFAHTEAYRLEMNSMLEDLRRDVDGLHAHLMKFGDMGPEKQDNGDLLVALGSLQSDMEAMKGQHNATVNAIQNLEEQNQELRAMQQDSKGDNSFLGLALSEKQPTLQEVADLRHELTTVRVQQQQQAAQIQDLEAQVIQHLQSFKEQQQNEALLLRQDLEAALAANSHGDGMVELRRKYEDVSRDVDVALHELRSERHAKGASLDQLAQLEAERQEREREINNLASFIQEEREERIRIDEALDQRQRQVSEETFQAVNEAFDEFRKEMRALADQMIRQGPDRSEIEGIVAKNVRPERDARAEFTRFLEAEREGRVQDVENEREARLRETAELRQALQMVSEKMAALPEAPSNNAVVSRDLDGVLADRVQVLNDNNSLVQTQMGALSARVNGMERDHATLVSSLKRDIEDVRTRSLAAERSGSVGTADLDALLAGLEEETAKRCEVCADLHARITRDGADLRSRVEVLWQELQESVRKEGTSRRSEMDALRSENLQLASARGAVVAPSPAEVEELRALMQEHKTTLNDHREQIHILRTREVPLPPNTSDNADAVRTAQQANDKADGIQQEVRSLLEFEQEEMRMLMRREREELSAEISSERAARIQDISNCRAEMAQKLEAVQIAGVAGADNASEIMKAIAAEREQRDGQAESCKQMVRDVTEAIDVERKERIAADDQQDRDLARIVEHWNLMMRDVSKADAKVAEVVESVMERDPNSPNTKAVLRARTMSALDASNAQAAEEDVAERPAEEPSAEQPAEQPAERASFFSRVFRSNPGL